MICLLTALNKYNTNSPRKRSRPQLRSSSPSHSEQPPSAEKVTEKTSQTVSDQSQQLSCNLSQAPEDNWAHYGFKYSSRTTVSSKT
jgi:hypothetical protein